MTTEVGNHLVLIYVVSFVKEYDQNPRDDVMWLIHCGEMTRKKVRFGSLVANLDRRENGAIVGRARAYRCLSVCNILTGTDHSPTNGQLVSSLFHHGK